MNICIFKGYLTCDPKLSPTKTGSVVVNFEIVTKRSYKRSNGEHASETTYLDMEAWDSGAKSIFETFKEGDGILIEASAKSPQGRIVFRVNRFEPLSRRDVQDE